MKTKEGRREARIRILSLLIILALPFALSINGTGGGGEVSPNSEFTLDGDLTTQEIILASSTITGSKHDFTFNATLTPKGECSACHNVRVGEPFLWTRSLTEEEAYFNQTSNPNYVVAPTIYCYDCHDNHDTVDNDPDYRYFINELSGRYIPQDVAFDSNLTDKLAYNSTPLDDSIGFYETAPPNSAPWTDCRPTGGHYIKSNPAGLANTKQGDKLPCTDCHEPHNSEPTNEVFLRGSAWFPLGGKVVKNLKASTKTRSGTGTGRAICINCHGYNDTGTPVRFVDINEAYGSTEKIIQTPQGVIEHVSTNATACTDCHTHDSNCGQCHGSPPYDQSHMTHYFEAKGPQITSCFDCHYFSSETHKNGDVNFGTDASANLTTTAACDNCHSPDGAFDGVSDPIIGAKPSWEVGVYESGTLRAGKEQWCVGCHDNTPAYSRAEVLDHLEIVVDDPAATFVGSWNYNSGNNRYGSTNRYHNKGSGSNIATWRPNLRENGTYRVWAWWTSHSNRATNAPYTIYYDGGSETVRVNQEVNDGRWYELGTYNFSAGTSGYVNLSDDADEYVIADAVKWERVYPGEIILDTLNATFSGTWTYASDVHWAYGSDHRSHVADDTPPYDTARWTPTIPEAGSYSVYAWWQEGDYGGQSAESRARNVKYTIAYDGGSTIVEVDQRAHGSRWNYLGTYDFAAGTSGYIQLSSEGDKTVIVDAIKLEPGVTHGTYAPNVIGDNTTYGFYVTGHKIDCLSCHDCSMAHIDHEHRTFVASLGNYQAGYRLASVDDGKPMNVPKPARIHPNDHLEDYALCYDCHNYLDVMGVNQYDKSRTNFRTDVGSNEIYSGHNFHLGLGSNHYDSDWDNVEDSTESCISCHNVHGAPNQVMVRHGELISANRNLLSAPYSASPQTDFNALNFGYLAAPEPPWATATWTANISTAGNYTVYGWWKASSNRATNANYTVNYEGGNATVTVNQQINGSQWYILGNYSFGIGNYSVVLTNEGVDGYIMVDGIGWDLDGVFTSDKDGDGVNDPEIVVNDHDPECVLTGGGWVGATEKPEAYNDDHYYHAKPTGVKNTTIPLKDSVGSKMDWHASGAQFNGICSGGCHSWEYSMERTPYLGPRVVMPEANPESIPPDGMTEILFTTMVLDPDDNVNIVTIDLSAINRSAAQTLYDDGTNGDQTAGDRIYSYRTTVPKNVTVGLKSLFVNATDSYGQSSEGEIELMVAMPNWIIVDNKEADYVGYWGTSRTSNAYGTYYEWHEKDNGTHTCTFTPAFSQSAYYNVYATWIQGSNRATDAPYTIFYKGGSETVRVDQKNQPGSQFVLLGTYYFNATSTAPVSVIVDNLDAEFVGDWTLSTGGEYYGTNYKYHAAGTGANTATFTPYLPQAGTYDVYGWWPQGTNRATDTPFTIHYSGGSETVYVDQEHGGDGWTYIGTYFFNAGSGCSVVLSDDANEYVMADAIKWQIPLEAERERVVLSDDANNYVIADAIMFEPVWFVPTIDCSNMNEASALVDTNTSTGNALDTGTEQYVVFDLGSNYTVTSIRMYTNGNNYTWNVSLGNDSSAPTCCNYSDWGTLTIEDWQTTYEGWTEAELTTPITARYLKLMRSDGSGDLNASSIIEFSFDPPDVKLTYELHSFADMHIYDPVNRHVGLNYATGKIENEIPGAVCSFGEVQTVSLPKLAVGEYRALLKGTGTGNYELIVTGESKGGKFVTETYAGTITKNEIHDATTAVNTVEVTNVTITVDEPPEPTVQTVGVANVTLAGLFPTIDRVDVAKIAVGDLNTASMPTAVVALYSAYMINATGSGEFTLRFDAIENAENITAVYKIAQDGSWIPLPCVVNGSTVEITLEAGDPPVVFTSATLSVVISPLAAALHVGEEKQFKATAKDPYGAPLAGVNVTWTSLNEAVGTNNPLWNLTTEADGKTSTSFTATEVGTTTVKATNNTAAGTARIRVLTMDVNVVGEETQEVEASTVTFTEVVNATVEGITFSHGAGEVTVMLYDDDPTGVDPVSAGEFDYGFVHFSIDVDPSLNRTAYISFKVPLADIAAAGLEKTTDIRLYQFSGGAWSEVPTTYVNDVGELYALFNATVSHFSDFAIGGEEAPAPTPTVTPTPPPASGGGSGSKKQSYLYPTPTPTSMTEENESAPTKPKANFNLMSADVTSPPTATPTLTPSATQPPGAGKRIPGFEGVFMVVGLLVIAYLVQRRRR